MTILQRLDAAIDWRWALGWLLIVVMLPQISAQALPNTGLPAGAEAVPAAASSFSTFLTNLVKRIWGGEKGSPPEWLPLVCAGVFGVLGTGLGLHALGAALDDSRIASKAVLDGTLAAGGGAVAIASSYKVARPNNVNVQKMQDQMGPCCDGTCTHGCRYVTIAGAELNPPTHPIPDVALPPTTIEPPPPATIPASAVPQTRLPPWLQNRGG